MVEPINLNRFRKAQARAEAVKKAEENRLKFGRSKEEKRRDAALEEKKAGELDDKKLE